MNDYVYGGVSGMCQTIVGYPFDTCKVLLQNNKNISDLKLKNLMSGVKYPLTSSIFICSINFGSYNYMRNHLDFNIPLSGGLSGLIVSPIVFMSDFGKIQRQMGVTPKWENLIYSKGFYSVVLRETSAFSIYFTTFHYARRNQINPFIAGGIAGLANWTFTYPIDVVRTRQIMHNCSMYSAIKQGKLWKGYIPCACRAILVNSVGFYVYDFLKLSFDKKL
tara:strand:- start:160 stop:819 length:660 start_codon:yes stop_codon:yes gene_type:complete